jgi:hypothetical protein
MLRRVGSYERRREATQNAAPRHRSVWEGCGAVFIPPESQKIWRVWGRPPGQASMEYLVQGNHESHNTEGATSRRPGWRSGRLRCNISSSGRNPRDINSECTNIYKNASQPAVSYNNMYICYICILTQFTALTFYVRLNSRSSLDFINRTRFLIHRNHSKHH